MNTDKQKDAAAESAKRTADKYIKRDGSDVKPRGRVAKTADEVERDRKEVVGLNQKVLDGLVRRIKALVEKGDRAADKAEQFYKAAGIHIKEIKDKRPEDWESIRQEVRERRERRKRA